MTVLRARSAPLSATTWPAPSVAPSGSPVAWVSWAELVMSLALIREPAERLAERFDDVAGDQRLLPHALRGDVSRQPVQVDAGGRRARGAATPGGQRAADPPPHGAPAAARPAAAA